MDQYFMHRIKHSATEGTWDKGIEVKDTLDAARQSYHAYLGAYAYGNNPGTDYVQVEVTDMAGDRLLFEVWNGIEAPEVD